MKSTKFRAIAAATATLLALSSVGTDALAQRAGVRNRERANDARDRATEALTGWTKLGEHWVNGGGDVDTILVGASEGRYHRVMLKVEHSALELFDVVFTFGDNSTFSPQTRLVFAQGTTTRVIDLPGDARIIRRVQFHYANLPRGGRAQVELWAQ